MLWFNEEIKNLLSNSKCLHHCAQIECVLTSSNNIRMIEFFQWERVPSLLVHMLNHLSSVELIFKYLFVEKHTREIYVQSLAFKVQLNYIYVASEHVESGENNINIIMCMCIVNKIYESAKICDKCIDWKKNCYQIVAFALLTIIK